MPCRMYSKPRPSSPMRSSTGISKSVEEQLVGIDGLAAHLLDLVHRDALAVEVGVEQAQALRSASSTSSSGVVRASSRILSATCAVEIQTFWPLTM